MRPSAPAPASTPTFGHPPPVGPVARSGGGVGGEGPPGTAPPRPVGPAAPFGATVACRPAPYPGRIGPGIDDAVVIGPVWFAGLAIPRSPERLARGSLPLVVPVVVPPRTSALIWLPDRVLGRAGLDTGTGRRPQRPDEAYRAVTCEAGARPLAARILVILSRPQCLPLSVTSGGRTETAVVPLGVRRCP